MAASAILDEVDYALKYLQITRYCDSEPQLLLNWIKSPTYKLVASMTMIAYDYGAQIYYLIFQGFLLA